MQGLLVVGFTLLKFWCCVSCVTLVSVCDVKMQLGNACCVAWVVWFVYEWVCQVLTRSITLRFRCLRLLGFG